MKGDQQSTSVALAHNHHEYTSPMKNSSARKRSSVRGHEDIEWVVETPKRRPPRTNSSSEKKNTLNSASSAIENDVDRIIRSVEEETAKELKTTKEVSKSPQSKPVNNRRATPVKRENEKTKQQQQLQVCKPFFF